MLIELHFQHFTQRKSGPVTHSLWSWRTKRCKVEQQIHLGPVWTNHRWPWHSLTIFCWTSIHIILWRFVLFPRYQCFKPIKKIYNKKGHHPKSSHTWQVQWWTMPPRIWQVMHGTTRLCTGGWLKECQRSQMNERIERCCFTPHGNLGNKSSDLRLWNLHDCRRPFWSILVYGVSGLGVCYGTA